MAGSPIIKPYKDSDGDWWFNNAMAANLLGMTVQSLANLRGGTWSPPVHGSPPSNGNHFRARDFGAWMMDVYSKRVDRKKSSGPRMPGFAELDGGLQQADLATRVNTATARLKEAQAQKAEIDAMEAAGSVLPVSEVEEKWSAVFSLIKTRMMKVPYACASNIADGMSQTEVQELIMEEVRRALNDAVDGRDVDADVVDED